MSNLRPPDSTPPVDRDAWAGLRAPEGEPLSVVHLIRAGTVDADLAALVWLMVEARVPLLVAAGPRMAGKSTILTALLEFLPASAVVRRLGGWSEDFAWLPEAARLGWRSEEAVGGPAVVVSGPPVSGSSGFLVANELSPHLPEYTWGEQARVAVRAVALGYGLGATIHGESLENVLDGLRGPDVRLTDDELSNLGLVLILRALRDGRGEVVRRIVAAHYVRPISRDAGGHVQRLAPAVLATWNERDDTFEQFAWGVTPELALRVGRRAGDFEAEHARRRDVLGALAAAGIESFRDVRTAIDGYRLAPATHRH